MYQNITDKIISLALQWQNRPLEALYTVVFFDAIFYKIRDEGGKVINKASYTCLGIDTEGHKDLLGIWVSETEGANFWLSVMTELKNRGVKDILIACVDGLKCFPEAINSIYPETEIQLCIVHIIRNTLKYVATKDRKEFAKDLKQIYTAPTEEAGLLQLKEVKQKWGKKYPHPFKSWEENWNNIATFFKYPDEIRRIIYTTNAVEALHRQFRKVTKSKSLFPKMMP